MKTPQQIKDEVEKGCGETFEREVPNKGIHRFRCGSNQDNERFKLCPSCQAKLSILKEYDKSIKEIIENLLKIKEEELVLWSAGYGRDGKKLKRKGFYANPDFNFIANGYEQGLKQLLSKMGDNSEVEK